MKRNLLLLAVLFSGVTFGQITLTNADFADGGDTVRMSIATDPGLDYSLTGANYTWDFSSLVANSQTLKEFKPISQAGSLASFLFGSFAPVKYKATNFASSTDIPLDQLTTFLPVSISDVNLFSKNAADSITSVGYSVVVSGTDVPFRSDTIETRYKFPMNYGNNFNTRGYSNLDMNPIVNAIWRQYRQRYSNVDGWGSITTPFGTFNALRVSHTIQETDSIFVEIGGNGTWLPLQVPTSVIYEWWTNGQKEPILRVENSIILGNEVPTKIEYRDNYDPALAGLEEAMLELTVYPNPVVNELHLEGIQAASYIVVDVNGSTVKSGEIAGNTTVDVSDLSTGSYSIILSGSNGFGMKQFVKQ